MLRTRLLLLLVLTMVSTGLYALWHSQFNWQPDTVNFVRITATFAGVVLDLSALTILVLTFFKAREEGGQICFEPDNPLCKVLKFKTPQSLCSTYWISVVIIGLIGSTIAIVLCVLIVVSVMIIDIVQHSRTALLAIVALLTYVNKFSLGSAIALGVAGIFSLGLVALLVFKIFQQVQTLHCTRLGQLIHQLKALVCPTLTQCERK